MIFLVVNQVSWSCLITEHKIKLQIKRSGLKTISFVSGIGDVADITSKASGKQLKKRDFQLIDTSDTQISVTLWSKQAEEFGNTAAGLLQLELLFVYAIQLGLNSKLFGIQILRICLFIEWFATQIPGTMEVRYLVITSC